MILAAIDVFRISFNRDGEFAYGRLGYLIKEILVISKHMKLLTNFTILTHVVEYGTEMDNLPVED